MKDISEPTTHDNRMSRAVDEYLAAWEAGRRPNRQEFLAQHAGIADALAECLDGLDFIRSAAPALRDSAPLAAAGDAVQPEGLLGDFRIVREMGRGGMGIVYEAVQISLGRRVALKVLPFASTLDPKQLQRFKNEAQAAAGLHHTNIVPVFATGCDRGVHYYAMQFIEGQTLAAIIHDLRQQEGREERGSRMEDRGSLEDRGSRIEDRGSKQGSSPVDPSPTGPYAPESEPRPLGSGPTPPLPDGRGSEDNATPPLAALSTERSTKSPAFFRTVAQLGIQAAEALEHAHSLGVIHRDIKPANMMVENCPLPTAPLDHRFRPRALPGKL